jgi:hypothetical protein
MKFQIPSIKFQINSKYQAPNSKYRAKGRQESQIPNTNDLNYFDFSSIDENIFFNSLASCIKFWASLAFFKTIYWFVIWNFGHWYLFVI